MKKPELKFHDKSCYNCRFYRHHKTGGVTSDCLLLGRTLSIGHNNYELIDHDRARICDGFKHRPKTWDIYSEGVDNNPHWVDKYFSREYLQKRFPWLKGR